MIDQEKNRQSPTPVLSVDHLTVKYGLRDAVRDASFQVMPGQRLAMVGESGSGKSTIGRAILGLLPPGGRVTGGSIRIAGTDMLTLSAAERGRVRGLGVGLVFQDPLSSLDPIKTIGSQVAESVRAHRRNLRGAALRERCAELLSLAGLPKPRELLRSYPHELSGGMRQRVLIAAAIAHDPKLLIADEPTSALDVRTQSGVLALLRDLCDRLDIGLVLITHDLGVVVDSCDSAVVLHDGRIEEQGSVASVFASPSAAYTQRLLGAIPGKEDRREGAELESADADTGERALRVSHLSVSYGGKRHRNDVVKNADLDVRPGETVGVVGESGAGKSTLGRALVRLVDPTSGQILIDSIDFGRLKGKSLRKARRNIQIVFQDPFTAMDPRMRVRDIVAQPISVDRGMGPGDDEAISNMLTSMDLVPELFSRRISELSGGQQQRVAVARALILEPKVVVLDEPTSALDASIRMKVLDLLRMEQLRLGTAFVFVTHDLSAARYFCDRIAVLKEGVIVEFESAKDLFDKPKHPYTIELIESMPSADYKDMQGCEDVPTAGGI